MAMFGVKSAHRTGPKTSARRALTAWLAVFALLVQAFAPLGAAWAFEDQSGGLQVICTANGVQTIAVDGDGKPLGGKADQRTCPFCVMHAAAAILAPALPSSVQPIEEAAQPLFRPTSDVHASVWRAGPRPPRGPPA